MHKPIIKSVCGEKLRSGAYPRVRNFMLILIGNGDFQESVVIMTSDKYFYMKNVGEI